MKGITSNLNSVLVVLAMAALATVVVPDSAFGQKGDLGLLLKLPSLTNAQLMKAIPEGCTEYTLLITTGDLEGAESDASIFVTLKGSIDSLRLEITGGAFERSDTRPHDPETTFCTINDVPKTFVRWGPDTQDTRIDARPNLFRRGKTTQIRINTTSVGYVESVVLEHDNWYPNWLVTNVRLLENGQEIMDRPTSRWFRADTLSQTFPLQQNRNVTDYRIKVFTGDVYQAGTNSKVYLALNGRSQTIPNIELGKIIQGNPFERNQTDETGIYEQPLLDYLPSINVTLEKGARWFLGSIKIESPNLFRPGIFRYNNWIEGGQTVTITEVEERLTPTRKITFRHEGFYMARMMIQYLENGPHGMLPKFVFTPDMPIGQNSVIEIPQDVKDPKVFLIGVGTLNNNFYTSDFVGYLSDDPCFKAWGGPGSPQGGTCDGKAVSTTATNPIRPSLYPKTTAEAEQNCFDMVQNVIPYDMTGNKVWDVSNVKKLCKGTKDPFTTVACYGIRTPDIGSQNAIAECSGQIPFGSTPKVGTATKTSDSNSSITDIPQNEQDCFNQVQGKVAYNTAGNRTWNEDNIKNLCRGTTNPPSTISCFSSKMPQIGWAKASQECAATNISSQTQRVNQMPIPSQNQPTSSGLNLDGSWAMYNDKGVKFDNFAKIAQSGSNLSINNGYGANSTAVLNGNSLKTSDGLNGTLSADGTRINWDINYVWVKQVSTSVTNPTPVTSPNSNGTVQTANSFGTARDIDAKNGAVWIIGTNPVQGGYGIYKLNGSNWTQIDGGATRIAVENTGNPWIVNSDGTIFRRTGNAWTAIAGPNGATPLDIAISNSGEVWIVTDTGTVSRWTGSGWTNLIALSARRVVFTPNPDTFQIVDENGKRFVRESGTSWIAATDASGMADKYIEFAVDGDTKWGIDSSFNIQRLSGGQSLANYTVAETQVQPASTIRNTPVSTKRSITFRNEAGFVAKMMVQYFESGPGGVPMPKFMFSDDIPVGQIRTLPVPFSAANMPVHVSLIGTGTMKNDVFSTTLDSAFTGDQCFKTWGTIFSPQGGRCQ